MKHGARDAVARWCDVMTIKIHSHGFLYSSYEYGAPLFAAFGPKGAPLKRFKIGNQIITFPSFHFHWKKIQKQFLYWDWYYCIHFDCSLESSDDYGSTSNAFIFSLRNKEGLGPLKSLVTWPSYAIYRGSGIGPTFGGGYDIKTATNANSNRESYARVGHSYSVPSGVQDPNTILAGTFAFTPDVWEVFYLA